MTHKFNPLPWTQAIEAALALLFTQQHGRSMSHYADLADWSRHHNTISLAAGCVTGLSTWIHTEATINDLIVVATTEEAVRIRRTMSPKAHVMAVDELFPALANVYRHIYVDGASHFSPHSLNKVYRCTARNVEQRWLLLG